MAESGRKLYVRTFGCQMNVYDSERMAETMGKAGYIETDRPEDADMILLNTCHIRERAAEKVYSELGRFRELKRKNPDLKIGVAGCVAQAEGAEIVRRQPLVDIVVGPQSYHRLPEIEVKVRKGEKAIDTEFPKEDKFQTLRKRSKAYRGPAAFLTVQEGCDKFCAFCVVPYTRGAESSRPASRVVAEAGELVDSGVREITLLGQNVNAYLGSGPDGKKWTLARLIYELSMMDGLERIRYTTSHPTDMGDDLIEAHRKCDKLMPHLHLPVQSGSNRILKRMNRGHTADEYLKLVDRIRKACPDILLSGDFIVGFPEETDDDFQATLDLVSEVGYGSAFSFKYSSRPGTPAAERMQVDEDVKSERLQKLQELLKRQQNAVQEAMIGREVHVLFEKSGRLPGQMVGKSDHLHAVHVNDEFVRIGDLSRVRIVASMSNSLEGRIVS